MEETTFIKTRKKMSGFTPVKAKDFFPENIGFGRPARQPKPLAGLVYRRIVGFVGEELQFGVDRTENRAPQRGAGPLLQLLALDGGDEAGVLLEFLFELTLPPA